MFVHIRKATKADVPYLGAVERSAATAFQILADFKPSENIVPPEILNGMAANDLLWVAETDSKEAAGFVGCRKIDNFLYVHEISVARPFQQQGIGCRLMQTAISAAANINCAAVGLTTTRHVAWNMPFYKKLGFSEISDPFEWPSLWKQLQKEIEEGANPQTRCAMIKVF